MLTCKEVTKLISDSMEIQLPLIKRIGIRIHLMMCKFCSRYKKQLSIIKEMADGFLTKINSDEIFPDESLSPEAKEHIKSKMFDK